MRPNRVFIAALLPALVVGAWTSACVADPTPAASSTTTTAAPSTAPSAAPTSQAQKLPPVVVTATRIEQPLSEIGTTVTVVDGDQIQTQQIQSIDNVLRQVPGVSVTQGGSPGTLAEVLIRGASPSQ